MVFLLEIISLDGTLGDRQEKQLYVFIRHWFQGLNYGVPNMKDQVMITFKARD
jgi:hypothetical protein